MYMAINLDSDLKKRNGKTQIMANLHSLFELISGPSNRLCISTFDLIGFLMQQFLPILLWPADLADPGAWRASKHRAHWLAGFINSENMYSFETFPFIPRAGENPSCSQ